MNALSEPREVLECMKRGGYYDTVMAAGSELDRVKAYLIAMDSGLDSSKMAAQQLPTYPAFPGLRHQEFHPAENIDATPLLENACETVHSEGEALLRDKEYLDYFHRGKQTTSADSFWSIGLLYYMGVALDRDIHCKETLKLVNALPGVCIDYPWGDALFSLQRGHSRLPAHCSVDALRVRCHLGLQIPDDCGIRVGAESRRWRRGSVLCFEDSYEHEVWNNSTQDRLVLIVDCWHPDLTIIEREALTAGFRKSEVRNVFYDKRLNNTNADNELKDFLDHKIKEQDRDPLISRYWR